MLNTPGPKHWLVQIVIRFTSKLSSLKYFWLRVFIIKTVQASFDRLNLCFNWMFHIVCILGLDFYVVCPSCSFYCYSCLNMDEAGTSAICYQLCTVYNQSKHHRDYSILFSNKFCILYLDALCKKLTSLLQHLVQVEMQVLKHWVGGNQSLSESSKNYSKTLSIID